MTLYTRDVSGTWTDMGNLTYVFPELSAALDFLTMTDQRLNGGSKGSDGLGEHFEVRVSCRESGTLTTDIDLAEGQDIYHRTHHHSHVNLEGEDA